MARRRFPPSKTPGKVDPTKQQSTVPSLPAPTPIRQIQSKANEPKDRFIQDSVRDAFSAIDARTLDQQADGDFWRKLQVGTFATRPTPGVAGRLFLSYDTMRLYRDTGAGWDLLLSLSLDDLTGTVSATQVEAGFLVAHSRFTTGAVATGTTTTPFDDTIPQQTEGNEFLTLAHTAKEVGNILVVRAYGSSLSGNIANQTVGALYQDATANAFAAAHRESGVDVALPLLVEGQQTVTDLSSHTFKFRAGMNGAGTLTFNGRAAARLMGGVECSFLEVMEYSA